MDRITVKEEIVKDATARWFETSHDLSFLRGIERGDGRVPGICGKRHAIGIFLPGIYWDSGEKCFFYKLIGVKIEEVTHLLPIGYIKYVP